MEARIRQRLGAWHCLLLGGLALVPGCGGETGAGSGEVEGDRPLGRTLVEVVALGSDQTGPGFRDVRGHAVDEEGRIWVAEWGALIHLFEADATHVRSWNVSGAGPGEVRYLAGFDRAPGSGLMLLRDVFEVTLVDRDLNHVGRWQLPRAVAGGLPGIGFDASGAGVLFPLVERRDSVVEGDARLVWTEGRLIRIGLDGAVTGEIAELVGGWQRLMPGVGATSLPAYAGTAVWTAVDTLGVLVGDGQRRYVLHLVSNGGDTLRTYRRPFPDHDLPALDGTTFTRGAMRRVVWDPARQEILVCRAQPYGRSVRESFSVDHFSLDGAYLGSLEWPSCPERVSADGTVFLTAHDEFGAPWVRGYRYDR